MTSEFAELEKLGLELYQKGNLIGSLRFFERGLKIALDARDAERCAGAHLHIGIIMLDKAELNLAGENFDLAMVLFRKTGNIHKEKLSSFYHGKVCCLQGNYGRALEKLEYSCKISPNGVTPEIEAELCYYAGISSCGLDYYDISYEYLQKASRLYIELQDKKGIADTAYNLGNLYLKAEQPKKSGTYFDQAILIYNELKDISSLAEAAYGLAETFIADEKYEGAENLLNYAAGLFSECGLKCRYAAMMVKIAELHQIKQNWHAAAECLARAIHTYHEAECRDEAASVIKQAGVVHLAEGNREKARTRFLEAIDMLLETGKTEEAIDCLNKLAGLCTSEGCLIEARHYLLEAEELVKKNGIDKFRQQIDNMLIDIEEKISKFERRKKFSFLDVYLKKFKII